MRTIRSLHRHLVFRAWTTPEVVVRLRHAKRGEMTVVEIDLRVGGAWRYAIIADGGLEVAFHGEYREIVPDERLVWTGTFEAMPQEEALNTLTLSEVHGRTALTVLVEHSSPEFRDAHVASGIEDGLQDALDLLEELATSLR
jgi:uncharacterized protein YndB with AHSA1/START domain